MRTRIAAIAVATLLSLAALVARQDVEAGRKVFESRCARCHGADGNGGEMGPPIVLRIGTRDDGGLAELIHQGVPARGMPPNDVGGCWPKDSTIFSS
jgi:alcohol dehydrogenase (cytochrome c)